jgi:hypothetical protein
MFGMFGLVGVMFGTAGFPGRCCVGNGGDSGLHAFSCTAVIGGMLTDSLRLFRHRFLIPLTLISVARFACFSPPPTPFIESVENRLLPVVAVAVVVALLSTLARASPAPPPIDESEFLRFTSGSAGAGTTTGDSQ